MAQTTSQGAMPVFAVYNVPFRDCGNYSAGGVTNTQAYQNWITSIADAIGNGKAAIILEPDGLSLIDCLSAQQKTDRFNMIKNAVTTLKAKSNIAVYIDAGHPNWISAGEMANRLKQSGIDQADGFALNVSNFTTTSDNANYGQQISSILGGKHFVIDTARNGLGSAPDNQWCNPPGRVLGSPPTTNTGNSLIDAYLWLKAPGESDGSCNGGPSAGTFWPEYALGLAQRANW
jgi:endoglucanase